MVLVEPSNLVRLFAVLEERKVSTAPDFLSILFGDIEHRKTSIKYIKF